MCVSKLAEYFHFLLTIKLIVNRNQPMPSPQSPSPTTTLSRSLSRSLSTSSDSNRQLDDINDYILSEQDRYVPEVTRKEEPQVPANIRSRNPSRGKENLRRLTSLTESETEGSPTELPSVIDSDGSESDSDDEPFWSYGEQSKGPPSRKFRISISSEQADPHESFEYRDPVFDNELSTEVKHTGKARIGDGNDITPDPSALTALGTEIKELKSSKRQATGVEKQNLHSKICRSKQKAKHEANKILFDALEKERDQYSEMVLYMRRQLSHSPRSMPYPTYGRTCYQHKQNFKPWITVAGRFHSYISEVIKDYYTGKSNGYPPPCAISR